MSEQFWSRWRTEYLAALQERPKWNRKHADLKLGDVVLVKEEDGAPRCQWPLGLITEVYPSEDGLVRRVQVKIGGSVFIRPIHKLVSLVSDGIPCQGAK